MPSPGYKPERLNQHELKVLAKKVELYADALCKKHLLSPQTLHRWVATDGATRVSTSIARMRAIVYDENFPAQVEAGPSESESEKEQAATPIGFATNEQADEMLKVLQELRYESQQQTQLLKTCANCLTILSEKL